MRVEAEQEFLRRLASGELAAGDLEAEIAATYEASPAVIERWTRRVLTKHREAIAAEVDPVATESAPSAPAPRPAARAAPVLSSPVAAAAARAEYGDGDGAIPGAGAVMLTGAQAALWSRLQAATRAVAEAERQRVAASAEVAAVLQELARTVA